MIEHADANETADADDVWVVGTEQDHALLNLMYDELRRIAAAHLRTERPDHTLSPTGLAHEAWMRLQSQHKLKFKNRGHYLATASMMMRRILVNHAMSKQMQKRDAQLVSLDDTAVNAEALLHRSDGAHDWVTPTTELVLQVHEALKALAKLQPRTAQVVEMKFFGGVEQDDIAQSLGISLATVKREWQFAKAWLHRRLHPNSGT